MASPLASLVRAKKTAPKPRFIRDVLRGAAATDRQIIEAVNRGLPSSALDELLDAGLNPVEIARVVGISERTLARKRAARSHLGIAESDRTIRLARIIADAERYIGNRSRALSWLRKKNWALGDRVPLDLLTTEPGVELVRQSLVTIAYGGVA